MLNTNFPMICMSHVPYPRSTSFIKMILFFVVAAQVVRHRQCIFENFDKLYCIGYLRSLTIQPSYTSFRMFPCWFLNCSSYLEPVSYSRHFTKRYLTMGKNRKMYSIKINVINCYVYIQVMSRVEYHSTN